MEHTHWTVLFFCLLSTRCRLVAQAQSRGNGQGLISEMDSESYRRVRPRSIVQRSAIRQRSGCPRGAAVGQ